MYIQYEYYQVLIQYYNGAIFAHTIAEYRFHAHGPCQQCHAMPTVPYHAICLATTVQPFGGEQHLIYSQRPRDVIEPGICRYILQI